MDSDIIHDTSLHHHLQTANSFCGHPSVDCSFQSSGNISTAVARNSHNRHQLVGELQARVGTVIRPKFSLVELAPQKDQAGLESAKELILITQ